MTDWLEALIHCRSTNTSCVVVMITKVAGSAPRSVGTRMLVTPDTVTGTVGGGALELEGISHARALLHCAPSSTSTSVSSRQITLGQELAQCCSGRVELQFDCHMAIALKLHVFGAGHVAQEVARLALRLPCTAVFHDTRAEWLAQVNDIIVSEYSSASQVSTCLMDNAIFPYVDALDASAYYLVMTHSHETDLDVVEAVLSRADAAFCGLIASEGKAVRFRNRLRKKGFSEQEISQLVSPLGQGVVTGNTPMEVAVAGIGDVLTAFHKHSGTLDDASNEIHRSSTVEQDG